MMKCVLGILIIATFGLCHAGEMRMANGKPCYPTEKTYFDSDGVTPLQCAAASGPPYSFQVYVGDKIIWQGKLQINTPEVSYSLPSNDERINNLNPRLVIMRDLKSDPTGHTFFFGESHLAGFVTSRNAENSVQLPEIVFSGKTIQVNPALGAVTVDIGKINGALIAGGNYRVVVTPE